MPTTTAAASAVCIERTRPDATATDPCAAAFFPPVDALVVLLGDPSAPCFGKLNSSWNPEDLATQDRLLDVLRPHWTETPLAKLTVADALSPLPARRLYVLRCHASLLADVSAIAAAERARTPAVALFVFNLCDEGWNNDALRELHVPAMLDVLDVPYSGAGPACLAFCYDKGLVNAAAARLGVPTAREACYLSSLSTAHASSDAMRAELLACLADQALEYPVFIKPMRGDNSLGITPRSLVHSPDELHAYVSELAAQQLGDVLLQEYLSGNEYSVAVVGNAANGYLFFPTLRVDYTRLPPGSVPILGFESKWDPKSVYWTHIRHVRADDLRDDALRALYARCVLLFERFGCRDYARFDFRASAAGTITLLEVNPNPGWCWDGKMATMAAMGGLDYAAMVALILRTGWARASANCARAAPLPPPSVPLAARDGAVFDSGKLVQQQQQSQSQSQSQSQQRPHGLLLKLLDPNVS